MLFKHILIIAINWLYYTKYYPNKKHLVKNNILLPILYNDNHCPMSIEHIYPKCFLKKDHFDDFHNMFKASKYINNIRSNYMYSDLQNITWQYAYNNNYVCHKYKLFNPRDIDKGIIARAILYMNYKYNYKLLVNKQILFNWCLKYEPNTNEHLHNLNGLIFQGNSNPFISKFYDQDYICFIKNILDL